MPNEKQPTTVDALLRAEIAATGVYQRALEQLGDDPRALSLRQIHVDHREAATALKQHAKSCDETTGQASVIWAAFPALSEGSAAGLASPPAFKAMKEGEELEKKEYDRAMLDAGISAECKMLIASTLLPQTENHIATLHRLLV
jgi:ferritin-like metal-binding protein YciE